MSLHEDEEKHLSSLPMLEVPLELDQEGFSAVVGKGGLEQEDEDHQQAGAVALEGQVKRDVKLNDKGSSLKPSTLYKTKTKMSSRLIRQSGAIDNLIYSSKNIVTVKEELESRRTFVQLQASSS